MFASAVRFLDYPLPLSLRPRAGVAFSPEYPGERLSAEFYAKFLDRFFELEDVTSVLVGPPPALLSDVLHVLLEISSLVLRRQASGSFPFDLFLYLYRVDGGSSIDLLKREEKSPAAEYRHRFLVDNLIVFKALIESVQITGDSHYSFELVLTPNLLAAANSSEYKSKAATFSVFLLNFRLLDRTVFDVLDFADALRNRKIGCLCRELPRLAKITRGSLVLMLYLNESSDDAAIEYFNYLAPLSERITAEARQQDILADIAAMEAQLKGAAGQIRPPGALKAGNTKPGRYFDWAAIERLGLEKSPEEIAQILLQTPNQAEIDSLYLKTALKCGSREHLAGERYFDCKFDLKALKMPFAAAQTDIFANMCQIQAVCNEVTVRSSASRPPAQASLENSLIVSMLPRYSRETLQSAFGVRSGAISLDLRAAAPCAVKFCRGCLRVDADELSPTKLSTHPCGKALEASFRVAGFAKRNIVCLDVLSSQGTESTVALAVDAKEALVCCLFGAVL